MTQKEFDKKIKDLEQLEIDLYKRHTKTSNPAYYWAERGARMARNIILGDDATVIMAALDLDVAFPKEGLK